MTPAEMDLQVPPHGATRHAMSIRLGQRVFYTDTHAWNGFRWFEVGDTTPYSSPLDEPAFLPVYKSGYYMGRTNLPIGSKND